MSCVILVKFLNCSVSQFLHLKNGNIAIASLMEFRGLNVYSITPSKQHLTCCKYLLYLSINI